MPPPLPRSPSWSSSTWSRRPSAPTACTTRPPPSTTRRPSWWIWRVATATCQTRSSWATVTMATSPTSSSQVLALLLTWLASVLNQELLVKSCSACVEKPCAQSCRVTLVCLYLDVCVSVWQQFLWHCVSGGKVARDASQRCDSPPGRFNSAHYTFSIFDGQL